MKNILEKYNKYILLIIILVGAYMRIVHIFSFSPFMDAWPHLHSARNIVNGLDFTYNRNILYTYSIALSFLIFGVSIRSARVPGMVAGVFNIYLVYYVTKYFTKNKNIALLASLIYALSPWMIGLSAIIRGYIYLQTFFMLIILFLYKSLHCPNRTYNFKNKLLKLLNRMPYNYLYILITIVIFIIGYSYHRLIVLVIPGFLVYGLIYYFIKCIKDREFFNKYIVFFGLFLIGIILLIIYLYFGNGIYYFDYLYKIDYEYGYIQIINNELFMAPFFLVICYFIIILRLQMKEMYIFLFYIMYMIVMIYYYDRYVSTRYISPIYPVFIICYSYGLYYLIFYIVKYVEILYNKYLKFQNSFISVLKKYQKQFLFITTITIFFVFNIAFLNKSIMYYNLNMEDMVVNKDGYIVDVGTNEHLNDYYSSFNNIVKVADENTLIITTSKSACEYMFTGTGTTCVVFEDYESFNQYVENYDDIYVVADTLRLYTWKSINQDIVFDLDYKYQRELQLEGIGINVYHITK